MCSQSSPVNPILSNLMMDGHFLKVCYNYLMLICMFSTKNVVWPGLILVGNDVSVMRNS